MNITERNQNKTIQEIVDMDTNEKIRYISESSNTSTSGYSTMSPVLSSPAHSPATMLQTEFSNLNLPSNSPQLNYSTTTATMQPNFYPNNYVNYGNNLQQFPASTVQPPQQPYFNAQPKNMSGVGGGAVKYPAELRIIEQPVEKFRFRYKSEMHGTHGSLNGVNSKRIPKTYPEVELLNFNERATIRCSLFQTNLDSPHSHQLVVRRDESDIGDPHDLEVSPERGFVAQFQNMGIIHTAKKYIPDELLKKKINRLKFELGREDLSTKQMQELRKATEQEAKDMNLNQVRLCFEAFKIENNQWIPIAAPVYTNSINNRKSAQTGELRIVRLSIATGSVNGGDDLILLVEKVSKKNIKVRFYELNDDEEQVWEGFGRFREADVHHQYAIICQTPAYKNKEIDKPVEVFVELVRPSDDERSCPVTFRYKPRDSVVSRKRRRTCSTATSSSGSGSSVNSFELPKTVQDQQQQQQQQQQTPFNIPMVNIPSGIRTKHSQTISEEYNKDTLFIEQVIRNDSEDILKMCFSEYDADYFELDSKEDGCLEPDGAMTPPSSRVSAAAANSQYKDLRVIFKIFNDARKVKDRSPAQFSTYSKEVANIYTNHAEKNGENKDSLMHEIIIGDNRKLGIDLCKILSYFKLNELLNVVLNADGESGLHCACLNDRALYIRPLLGLGCKPNIPDINGNTAMHVAVRDQHLDCVESFLKMPNVRVDLALRNDDGLTALHLAVMGKSKEIVKRLLDYNHEAAFIKNSKEGNNALHIAVRQQRIDLIQLILSESKVDKKAILSSLNAAGHTALDIAKCFSSKTGLEIVRLLSAIAGCDDSDREPGNLVIKEEEISSSSADDDDDIDEKFSINEDENASACPSGVTGNAHKNYDRLRSLLSNESKYKKIAKLLNEKSKWKELAKKIEMKKFLVLWLSAEALLDFVRSEENVKYETFVAALAEVDRDALEVLLTPMN